MSVATLSSAFRKMVFRADPYYTGKIQARAAAAKEQPRKAVDEQNRHMLPHGDPFDQLQSPLLHVIPLDCRLLIWECVLKPSQTRIERWRPINAMASFLSAKDCDADCFPYRISTAGHKKMEKPLNLLLCCRQLYLEGLSILYSTTFVFDMPLDLYDFQLCVSPEGFAGIMRVVIDFGHVAERGWGPFYYDTTTNSVDSIDDWEHAIRGLKKMARLHELQIWLGHRHVQSPESERRPWKNKQGDQRLEQRHQKLFDLFGTINVPQFTVHLTWKPVDLLAQRKWPFQVELHTKAEMMRVLDHDLPEKTEPDIYDW